MSDGHFYIRLIFLRQVDASPILNMQFNFSFLWWERPDLTRLQHCLLQRVQCYGCLNKSDHIAKLDQMILDQPWSAATRNSVTSPTGKSALKKVIVVASRLRNGRVGKSGRQQRCRRAMRARTARPTHRPRDPALFSRRYRSVDMCQIRVLGHIQSRACGGLQMWREHVRHHAECAFTP